MEAAAAGGDVRFREGVAVCVAEARASGGGEATADAAEFDFAVACGCGNFCGLVSEVPAVLHDFGPDGEGDLATVGAVGDFFWEVEADPDPAGEGRGVTYEPGVMKVVGGAGFPACRGGKSEGSDGGTGAAWGEGFAEGAVRESG